jgi:hypothetical protein
VDEQSVRILTCRESFANMSRSEKILRIQSEKEREKKNPTPFLEFLKVILHWHSMPSKQSASFQAQRLY